MAMRSGIQTTSNQSTEGRAVRDVSPVISQLEPNKYPLVVFLNAIQGRKQVTGNKKFEWIEDILTPRYDTLGGSLTAAASSMTVSNYSYFVKNMLVRVNRSEIVRVTATPSSSSVSIARGVGETAAAAASNGDQLHIIGMAYEEGGSFGSILSMVKTNPYNYCQIFRRPIGLSGTAAASKVYGPSDREYDRAQMIIEHAKDIENAFIMGERSLSSSGGVDSNELRTTRGVLAWISTMATDVGGTMTETEFDEILRKGFRYGSDKKLGIFSSKVCSVVNGFAKSKLETQVKENTYGVDVTGYKFAGGKKVLISDHPLLENDSITDLDGLAGTGVIIDVADLKLRFMEGRYMKHITDAVVDGADADKEEILSEAGLELRQEKKHSEFTGVTD